jgi:hypothetical protein
VEGIHGNRSLNVRRQAGVLTFVLSSLGVNIQKKKALVTSGSLGVMNDIRQTINRL